MSIDTDIALDLNTFVRVNHLQAIEMQETP